MPRLLHRVIEHLHDRLRPMRDRLMAKMRAHVALAVNDDLRQLISHVTNERISLEAALTDRIETELRPVRQQMDDLLLCNGGLLREVVRLQRELQRLSESLDALSLHGSLDDSRGAVAAIGLGESQRRAA